MFSLHRFFGGRKSAAVVSFLDIFAHPVDAGGFLAPGLRNRVGSGIFFLDFVQGMESGSVPAPENAIAVIPLELMAFQDGFVVSEGD